MFDRAESALHFGGVKLEENMVVAEKFRLNRLLGRGGMGSVWHATHIGLDTACAVKFIEGNFATLPEAHQRLEREAKAAAQLRSPHVVQIMDNGVWEGRPYIAMELLDGEDLKKRLSSGKMLPNEIASILTQVCRALSKAHALGIVHRDLKPDNIFLVRDDDREIAKVLDFGIAKRNDALEGSNTRTGAMLGTPYYMSPEQAQGIKSVDHRSDLWSLAVIAYQAIVGQLPFQSEALGDLLVKIIVHPIPTPSLVAQVPPGFDAWWAKATQRDPNGRFQSAKDFAESLTLAIGASQLTDVMDRRKIGGGSTSSFVSGPQLPFGSTPQPGGMPFGQTPHPNQMPPGHGGMNPQFAQTPSSPSAMTGVMPNGFPTHGSTGAPFTTTASGSTTVPVRSLTGVIVGGVLGVIAMFFVGVGAFLHFSSHAAGPTTPLASASASSTSSIAATAATTAPTTPPITSAVASAVASAAPTTVTPPDHGSDHSDHGSHPSADHTSTSAAASASAKSTHPTKSSKSEDGVDKMGF